MIRKHRFKPLEVALLVVPLCALAFAWWQMANQPAPEKPFVPPRYSILDLGAANTGSWICDMNDKGEIVGAWGTSNKTWRPVVWRNGKMSFLSPQIGIAAAINNKGSIVLNLEQKLGNDVAYLWKNNKLRALKSSKISSSYGEGINDKDEIVGFTNTKDKNGHNNSHAFLWRTGVMQDISGDDNSFGNARSINERGEVVGISNSLTACYWADGNLTYLSNGVDARDINAKGTILGQGDKIGTEVCWWANGRKKTILAETGSKPLFAMSINNNDQVVGATVIKNSKTGATFAFLYASGQIYDLNTLIASNRNYKLFIAYAINNRGQIVCEGILNAKRHIFLLTPIASRSSQQSSTR